LRRFETKPSSTGFSDRDRLPKRMGGCGRHQKGLQLEPFTDASCRWPAAAGPVDQGAGGLIEMMVLEPKDVVALLRFEVSRAGGQAAWASRTGVNRIVVNKILNGHGLPTKKIIRALKLRTVFVSELELPQSK
jgi:hypothetical protein